MGIESDDKRFSHDFDVQMIISRGDDIMVDRVGHSGAREPPEDPRESEGGAGESSREGQSRVGARREPVAVSPGGRERDAPLPHGHPAPRASHEPQAREAGWI